MTMTERELQAIRERVEAATPGPWKRWGYHPVDVGYVITEHPRYMEEGVSLVGSLETGGMPTPTKRRRALFFPERPEDAIFIAAARTDIPTLLAEVTVLRAENAALREAMVSVDELRAISRTLLSAADQE